MVVFEVQETDSAVLIKNSKNSVVKINKKKSQETSKQIVPVKKYEDKTSLSIEDILPENELKKLPEGKTEGYLVRKLILLMVQDSMEDNFITASKKSIKGLRKFLKETAEGQELLALMENLRIAEKNKSNIKKLQNDLKKEAKDMGIDLNKHKVLTGMEQLR